MAAALAWASLWSFGELLLPESEPGGPVRTLVGGLRGVEEGSAESPRRRRLNIESLRDGC